MTVSVVLGHKLHKFEVGTLSRGPPLASVALLLPTKQKKINKYIYVCMRVYIPGGPIRVWPTRDQGGPQRPCPQGHGPQGPSGAHKGPGRATKAQGGPQRPRAAYEGPTHKGPARKGPMGAYNGPQAPRVPARARRAPPYKYMGRRHIHIRIYILIHMYIHMRGSGFLSKGWRGGA